MSPLKKIIFIIAQNITKKAEKTHLVKYIFRTHSRACLKNKSCTKHIF